MEGEPGVFTGASRDVGSRSLPPAAVVAERGGRMKNPGSLSPPTKEMWKLREGSGSKWAYVLLKRAQVNT